MTSSLGNILVVDDQPANLRLLSDMLNNQGYEVRAAIDGPMALMTAQAESPELILLDVNMPQMDGYEVCSRLKADPATAAIPVIFISGLGETMDKVKAFHVGGVDYITKPIQVEEVMARVESQLTLYRQRRTLEEQRREIECLRDQDRLYFEKLSEIKDQFLRMASHDLKNPIGAIMGYVDIMLHFNQKVDEAKREEYLHHIRGAAEQMHRLVMDLLDLAKIETGLALVPEPTLLNGFLRQNVSMFEVPAQQKQIQLSLDLSPEDVTLQMDPARMGQVLSNLISNAIKYTPEGGSVAVSAERQNGYVVIRVRDNGLGIPEKDLPHLFERFYRVKDKAHLASEGTGLGLSIVKALVEQHNGQIQVESRSGEGSVFSVALPV